MLFLFLIIVLSTACSHQTLDNELDLDNIKVLAEAYDGEYLSKDKTNWVPGFLFPTESAYEEIDFIVFSQRGVVSLNPFFFRSILVPEEYVSFSGPAPERYFELLIKIDGEKVSPKGNELNLNLRKVPAEVEFSSMHYCLGVSNTQTVLLTVSGNLTAQDATDGRVHYAGNLILSIELPDNKAIKILYHCSDETDPTWKEKRKPENRK